MELTLSWLCYWKEVLTMIRADCTTLLFKIHHMFARYFSVWWLQTCASTSALQNIANSWFLSKTVLGTRCNTEHVSHPECRYSTSLVTKNLELCLNDLNISVFKAIFVYLFVDVSWTDRAPWEQNTIWLHEKLIEFFCFSWWLFPIMQAFTFMIPWIQQL